MQIEINTGTDIVQYNRKTTDYGNGHIEIVTYHMPKRRSNTVRRIPTTGKVGISDEEQRKRTRSQISAIRRKIKGYALTNDFTWFVTLTYNPQIVDSKNYDTAKNTFLKWCRRMRDTYKKFDYLLIPELHKSGAVHFHGLLGNVSANFKEAQNTKTGKSIIRNNRPVYNLSDWKYGFSDCEKIENPERSSVYITKYVTDALLTNKEMYHKKRYFNSQGLNKPKITFEMTDNRTLEKFTPNFGLIDTDHMGNNFIDTVLYKMMIDEETGGLIQQNDDYVMIAKK